MSDELDAVNPERTEARTAEQAASAKRERDDEARDVSWLMGSRRGRHIWARLLQRCGYLDSPFSSNGMVLAHAAGRQSVGLELFRLVRTLCPDQCALMEREEAERERERANRGSSQS